MASLASDSAITFLARGNVIFLTAANSILVSRVLGPSLNGSYRIILLVVSVVSLFAMFGLGAANVYFGAREPDLLPVLTGNAMVAAIGLGLIGILAVEVTTLTPQVSAYLDGNNVDVGWVRGVILFLPLVQMRAFVVEIIRAKGDIIRYNLVALWHGVISLVAAVVLVWIMDLGLRGAIGAWALASIAATLLTLWVVLRSIGGRPRVSMAVFRRTLSFGARLYPGNIAQYLNYRLDLFFVGFFLQPAAVGFYATATAVAELLWELPHAIRTVLLYQVAARETETALRMTARVSRIIVMLMGLFCLLTALLSPLLVKSLYGREYLPAAPALVYLLPGIWTLSMGKLIATHLSAVGRPDVGTVGAVVSLIATVALDLILIPRLGIIGAAIASSIAYSVSALVIALIFLKLTGLRWRDIALFRRDDAAVLRQAVSGLSHGLSRRFFQGNNASG